MRQKEKRTEQLTCLSEQFELRVDRKLNDWIADILIIHFSSSSSCQSGKHRMLGALMSQLGAWLYSFAEQELTWRALLVYGFIFLMSWLFSKLFIFPSLSPLRKMPGRPVTWKNILWGQLPEILNGDPLDLYYGWTREMKAGIVRYRLLLGDQRVLVADPEAVKQILVAKVGKYPRPRQLFRFFVEILGDNLLTLEGHAHSVQRRLCNNAFKLTSVQGLLPTFQKHVEKLCTKLETEVRKQAEGPAVIEIQSWLANMTFDIISHAGFGHETDALMNPREKMSSAFTFIFVGGKFRLFKLFFPRLYSMLPIADNRLFRDSLEYIRCLIRRIIDSKREAVAGKKSGAAMDLLEMLLSATDVESGAKLSQKQLQDLVMAFMLAGHETTASSLTWILLSLANHPDIQNKARQEVTSHMPLPGNPVTVEDLDRMTYINCVVKEGLRLYPPGALVMREVAQDDELCGYPIPKGTIVTIALGALHRNPDHWQDPDEFKPERFLDDAKVPFFAYQPFICGPHTCIGNKFALQELRLALAMLLQRFQFSPLPDVMYRKKQVITLQPDPKLTLRVRLVQ